MKKSLLSGSGIALLALAALQPVHVQGQELEEITVTAQKRSQNLQDVGISITALTGEELRQLGMTTTTELASLTPGLMVSEFGNTPTTSVFTIRGVSQNDFSDHNETPNAMYLDDVYVSFVGGISAQMFDVERVEILRGPQGTLFGRNATGGLVHIISRKPTEKFEADAAATLGSYNQVKFEGAIGGPLSQRLLGRLSVATNRHDGFVRNRIGTDAAEDDQYNARAQLLWKASDSFDALLSLRLSRIDGINPGGYDIRAGAPDPGNDGLIDYVPPNVSNPTCLAFFGIPAAPGQTDRFGYTEADSDPYTASFTPGKFTRDFDGATLTMNWTVGGAELSWINDAQWIKKKNLEDSDGSPIDVIMVSSDQDATQYSSEFHLSGQRDKLNWLAGLYYLDIDGAYTVGLDSPLFAATISNDYGLQTRSEAVFAQIDYAFSRAWTVIAGLRYTWDQKDFAYRPSCTGPGCIFFEAPGSAQVLGLVADQKSSDYSSKLELDWHAADELLVYGSITRGMKAGGFSGPILGSQPPGDLPFGAEVLTDYEVGAKWTLPDGHTRINAGVFYYDYNDYQDYDTKNISQVITNKDAQLRGGEIELTTTPFEGISALLGVSVLDGEVFDIRLPSGRVADRKMPQAPSLSVTGLLRKEWHMAAGYLGVQGDFKYVGSRYFRSINYPAYHEDPYTVGNVRIGFAPESRNWEVAAFVKNVADTKYRVWSFEDLAVNGVINDNYGPPRWYGVTATMHW